jgi:CheY-like chemotaxis protein
MMVGTIAVQSREGVGSTFSVTLKEVATASVVDVEMSDAPSIDVNAVRFSSATILIVDDIEVNRNLVRAYLARFPFAVLEASNGVEALEVIEQHRPDLVLMDMKMPVMDGYEAIRILKERDDLRDIPVVALTASAMKQSEEVIRRVGDGYLLKPVSRMELVMKISQFLAHTFEEAASETIEPPPTDAVPVSVSRPLDGETLLKLPELIRRLEAERPAWEALCRTLTINDIEAFADQMRTLGVENNYGPLSAWGEQLGLQAGMFDLVAISAKLEAYPEIIGQMKALLNNEG